MTLKEYIEKYLCRAGLSREEAQECIIYLIKIYEDPEQRMHSTDFETKTDNYSKERIEQLKFWVDHFAFRWCIQKINSMK